MVESNLNINSKMQKIFSILLMLGSILLLVFLITYDAKDYSLNSTSIYVNSNSFYLIRNYIADFLLQIFGSIIYFVPIVFLIWSYKLFTNQQVKFKLIKLLTLFILLLIVPPLIYLDVDQYKGGVVGLFLSEHIGLFVSINYIIWILVIFLGVFASSFWIEDVILFSLIFNKAFEKIKTYTIIIINYFRNKNSKDNLKVSSEKSILNTTPDLDFVTKNKDAFVKDDVAIKTSLYGEDNELVETKNFNKSSYKITKEGIGQETLGKRLSSSINNVFKDYSVPLEFLNIKPSGVGNVSNKEVKENAVNLERIIAEFGINGKIVNVKTGPVVTLYEISIPAGVKTTKLISLETDIALRMKALSVRIAVVSGKDVIGIEIPNKNRKTIFLKEVFQSTEFINTKAKLPMALGQDIYGNSVVVDLVTMPHMLIAGTTGSGKSVGVNSMILSMLYKLSPDQCKLIMIDPKMLELSVYQDIPHLLTPVVINPKEAISALKWAVKEMEYRYYQMSLLGVRNLIGFNEKIENKELLKEIKDNLLQEKGIDLEFKYMPYIVVIIDEMADLMIVAGKEVEASVQRLAQMARAAGIHLIMATQRPSVDVITGTIKANFPTRISFQVSSKIDSRTILGEQGGEQLLGKGDMLYMSGVGRIQRVHGPFVADEEVAKVVEHLKSFGKPNYVDNMLREEEDGNFDGENTEKDELYDEAVAIIMKEGKVSTSFLQRKFQIGYNRAARIVEQLEEEGIVGKANHSGKREILRK